MADLHWPLFGLRIQTSRLELRYVDDELARTLAEVAIQGIHDEDEMPFSVPWTRQEPDALRREYLRHHWSKRALLTPDDWSLQLAVVLDGEVVGVQDTFAKDFPVTRSFETGSWLGRRFQGKGTGPEMRAAVLHLGFAGLGAQLAHTGCWEDNPRSEAVTRKLGYEPNGWSIGNRDGKAVRTDRFLLTRDRWERTRRDDITIEGLEACLPLLGLDR
jgi:RimJ/RimL family protein N-acetyltransferase